ncbi:MAG TPA: hypothetical protein P5081_23060 [Phycisphaerae bacterium]|nr:hypothetical protein [Phycisphaerae bacterium]HRW55763.1 hypothetical protein [Phycisphaerae bacterium]
MAGGVASINETLNILAALPPMGGAYVVALCVGGGLVLISALFGGNSHHDMDVDIGGHGEFDLGHDLEIESGADFDGDLDIETATDGHAEGVEFEHAGAHLSDWFSLRFVIYFSAMFGLTGTVLTQMTEMGRGGVLTAAIVAGLIVGQAVHQTMRWLKRSSSDSSTRPMDYLNRPGRVTVSIREGGRGEVAIQVRDGERCMPAVARRQDEAFPIGAQVAIVELTGGTAVVVSRQEHEFLNQA